MVQLRFTALERALASRLHGGCPGHNKRSTRVGCASAYNGGPGGQWVITGSGTDTINGVTYPYFTLTSASPQVCDFTTGSGTATVAPSGTTFNAVKLTQANLN